MTKRKKKASTCGDHGGRRKDGKPCRRRAGWGTGKPEGVCKECGSKEADRQTERERRFIDRYTIHGNIARAAREAGYPPDSARQRGWEIMQRPRVRAAISKLMRQQVMSSKEVRWRLSELARGTLEPFLTPEGHLDLRSPEAQANLHLLRKVKVTERIVSAGEEDVVTRKTELEIHDPKDAQVQIAKIHGLYAPERLQVEDVTPDSGDQRETGEQAAARILEALPTLIRLLMPEKAEKLKIMGNILALESGELEPAEVVDDGG